MIPLGSCTMKLNGTTEMEPITLPGFAACTRSRRPSQFRGYRDLFAIYSAGCARSPVRRVSLQPNAGAQGELAGLLAIRQYHRPAATHHRDRVPHPGVGARHERRQRRAWPG
jgi:glycine dehydrogenase